MIFSSGYGKSPNIQQNAPNRLGEWKYYSFDEDEELLGFHGILDPIGVCALGPITWRPPKH